MDTRINHWMRCIMDDIFGYERFLNEIIWCYNTQGYSKTKYSSKHDCILFYSKTKNHFFNAETIRNENPSESSIKRFAKEIEQNGFYIDFKSKKKVYELKASSNEGDLVADFYSGSFTTAEVCKDLKRNFIGCDINPNCFEKAKERGLFSFTDLTTNVD